VGPFGSEKLNLTLTPSPHTHMDCSRFYLDLGFFSVQDLDLFFLPGLLFTFINTNIPFFYIKKNAKKKERESIGNLNDINKKI